MTKPADDLDAIRAVVRALEPFDPRERERIIRWAAEKLGMSAAPTPALQGTPGAVGSPGSLQHPAGGLHANPSPAPKDIRSFVVDKNPKSDNQLAAVVAYYYHFEAAPAERKDSIGKEELIDACRKSDRKRPARPEQVLVNTYHAGLLDKAGSAGKYRLNSVGENLVAMVLPEQKAAGTRSPRKHSAMGGKRGAEKRAKPHPAASKPK